MRLRLTALATAVVAVVLTGTAVALVTVQRIELFSTLDNSLEQRAESMATDFRREIPPRPLDTNDEDRAVQVVDDSGRVLVTSTNLVGQAALVELGANQAELFATHDDLPLEDDRYRVLSRRIETAAGPATLHVAENIDDLSDALTNLVIALAITLPAITLVLAALTWWLTGRALAPVESIRAEVDSISTTNSGQRVPLPGHDDEIARLATTMNRMLDRLDDAAERQRRFVADAAHELRTPLTRIRTNVEVDIAQPERADPTATSLTVRDEVAGLQQLIDDLLHLARSDAGQRPSHTDPVDLDDIVLAEVRAQRPSGGPALDASRVSAAQVLGNADHLARVVRNLLTNAVRHARHTVIVELSESGDVVDLVVADDGAGVPAEHRARIFERFARVDDARTRNDGGTGLGLAIVRDIVEHHDGTVRYESSEAGGARFVVTLPSVQAGVR